MLRSYRRHPHHHHPPLTLTRRYIDSSSSQSATIIFLSIAVVLAICCSCSTAYAKLISNSTFNSKGKSCLNSSDCRNPHKECVFGECQCKSYFEYVPEHDICAKSYGASCTSLVTEELCNTKKFMACDEEDTCSCVKEGDSLLIYDPYLESCVAPPGHQCELIGYTDIIKECGRNARCVQDPNRVVDREYFGICECVEGFVGKGEKCVPEMGSKCMLDGDCDQEGVKCLKGTCQCADDRVYFEVEHECKLKVGRICEVAEGNCVDYAKCRGVRLKNFTMDWRCTCSLGYQENSDYGVCERDSHLNCPSLQLYDDWRGRCSIKVGGECDVDSVNLCVRHAFCGTADKCQCFDGYVTTVNGTCGKKIEVLEIEVVGSEDEDGELKSTSSHPLFNDTQLNTNNNPEQWTSSAAMTIGNTNYLLVICVGVTVTTTVAMVLLAVAIAKGRSCCTPNITVPGPERQSSIRILI